MSAGSKLEETPLLFAGSGEAGVVPEWALSWNARPITLEDYSATEPAGVLVLEAETPETLKREKALLNRLAGKLRHNPAPTPVVVGFRVGKKPAARAMVNVLKLFPGITSRVEVAWTEEALQERVEGAAAKYVVEANAVPKPVPRRPDALSEANEIIEATAGLRTRRGRLSARALAAALGLNGAQMAELLGRSRQTLAKTPDAPSLQSALWPLERIVRLRAVFPEEKFLAWLNRPNRHLDEHPPLAVVRMGRPEVVADLVETMLTGIPG